MPARHPPPVPIITGCILVQDILEPKGTRIISFFRVHKHSEPCCCSTLGLKGQPSFTFQDFATSSYRPWASSLILPTLISSLVKKKRGGKGKTIYLFHRANCLDMKDTQYSSWHRGGMLQISAVIISVPQTVLWSRQGNECYSLCSVVQLCLTLRNPIDYSLPGSSVHGIFQARKLEQVAIFCSRGSSRPKNQTCISCVSWIGRWILYYCATWEAPLLHLILATSIFTEEKLTNQRSNCRSLYTLHHSCYFSGHPVPLTPVLEVNLIIFLGFGFLVSKVSP